MSGRYPVQNYLHQVKLQGSASPDCSLCPGIKETLNHFTCLCPQFREASTAAHNQVRHKLYTSLSKLLPKVWVVHEEIPMHQTALRLDLVPADCMITAGRSLPDNHSDMISVGRLQPDMVLVSKTLKKIGLLEISSGNLHVCMCMYVKPAVCMMYVYTQKYIHIHTFATYLYFVCIVCMYVCVCTAPLA